MDIELLKERINKSLDNYNIVHQTIYVTPIGKVRMTQRDRWAKRPAVLKYYEHKDELNRQCKPPEGVKGVSWIGYFPFPKSYSKKKKKILSGKQHEQKPDQDNVTKFLYDSLFKEDSMISLGFAEKLWINEGEQTRIELYFHCLKQ